MRKEPFETKIIDTEKVESFNKLKQKASAIHTFIAIAVFGLFKYSTSNTIYSSLHTTWLVMGAILSIFLIGSAYMVVAVYIKTPSKGKLILHKDYLSFVIGRDTINIKIIDLSNFEFYFNNDHFKVCFNYKSKLTCLKLDIIFQKEKEELREIIFDWKKNGFDVKVFIDQSIKEQINQKTSRRLPISYESSRVNFTKNNIKIRPGIPFYATTSIPYKSESKNELISLSIICLESLGWKITSSDSERITALTDPVFANFGDDFSIKFYDNKFIISSNNRNNGLFTIGSKGLINTFLQNLTILSNDFSSEFLEVSSKRKVIL